MTNISIKRLATATMLSFAIISAGATPSLAKAGLSVQFGAQVKQTIQQVKIFNVAKKAKVTKADLKKACKASGGTFQEESNGVYRCISTNYDGGNFHIVECSSPRSCELYRLKD